MAAAGQAPSVATIEAAGRKYRLEIVTLVVRRSEAAGWRWSFSTMNEGKPSYLGVAVVPRTRHNHGTRVARQLPSAAGLIHRIFHTSSMRTPVVRWS